MIKNVVFDFGQVLVRFEPSYMVGRYVSEPSDARLLETVVFDRLYWDKLDAGTISDSEAVELIKARLPERLWNVASEIYYNWIYNIPEIDGMRDLVLHIKKEFGVSVFLLSNISRYFAEHSSEIPILELVDKCIFSAVCGKVKPDRDIYEYLCEECNIDPCETVFIDDREKNTKAAEEIGITGYVFDGDAQKLGLYLDGVLKN
ncbi:MAG: HAD family phosphatase [Ruminococcaceae bacterium]|nr:HAD family phosphatase [Oscillospiraceae bacterium]